METAPSMFTGTIEPEDQARANFRRIRLDTYIGMGFSNLVAFFIILSTAVTLNTAGITNIQTSAQAAEALRPIEWRYTNDPAWVMRDKGDRLDRNLVAQAMSGHVNDYEL